MSQITETDSSEQVCMTNARLQGMLSAARQTGYGEGLAASIDDDDVTRLAECFDSLVRNHGLRLSALFDDAHRHAVAHLIRRANDIRDARKVMVEEHE